MLSVLVLFLASPLLWAADPPAEPPPEGPPPETAEDAPPAAEASPPATVEAWASPRAPEVLVTAARVPETAFEAPYIAQSLTDTDIEQGAYRTLPNALAEIPAIMVQKTGHGQASPYIRGFTGFHTLMLIDGIRLNNSTFRSGPNQYWNTVDPLSVERLEAVKGPSSVLYGSDAIGGTVNAITKGPIGYGEGFQCGGRLSYRLSSAERSQVGRTELWTTWDHKLGLYIGGSTKHFGDLEGGRHVNTQKETGYGEWDLDFKAEYFLRPDLVLVFGHQTVRQNKVPRTHQTVHSEVWQGLARGGDLARNLWQERDLTYVQLHATELQGWVESMSLSLSWHEQNERRERERVGRAQHRQGTDVGTVGFWAQLESPSPIGRLVYGVEVYHDNVNSFNSTNPIQGPVADDASYDLVGVFLEDRFAACEKLDLIVGGRYQHARARAASVQDPVTGLRGRLDERFDALVGSARFVYHCDDENHWNVFGGVSQGYRAPNLSDLTRFDTARTLEFETPAPGVDPEHFLAYEIGVKAEYEQFAARAAWWYTAIDDMIIRTPTGAIVGGRFEVTKQNAGRGYVTGVEFGASWRFLPQWTAFGTFAWLDGQVETFPTPAPMAAMEPIDRRMPTTGRVGLRWDDPAGRCWAEAEAVFADDADDLSTRDARDRSRIPPGGTPGYGVVSLRGGYRVSENVDLTLAIENITNEDYRIHGSGLNEPGRNFIFGLEVSF